MKAILNYENYFNRGKQYHLKFLYNNETVSVSDKLNTLINQLIMKGKEQNQLIQPYYIDKYGKITHDSTNNIAGINIPSDLLLEVINTIIIGINIPVSISNMTYTQFNEEEIKKSINQLHINGILTKGNYFNFGQVYYITFKYANDEQRNELSYGFNYELQHLTGDNIGNGTNFIFPFIVDRTGKLSINNTGIIGGTNIPEALLPFFIKKFIEEYNMIITIDDKITKDETSSKEIQKALAAINSLKQGRARKRTML